MFRSALFRLTVVFPGPGVPPILPNTVISARVSVSNAGTFTVYINGNLLTSVSDTSISTATGQVGVSAHSNAQFDNFAYTTACGNDCSGASNQGTCSFTCASGLLAVGLSDSVGGSKGTRTCVASGAVARWVPAPQVAGGRDMVCTLAAPLFPAATLSVAELSPQNTLVGNPLTATISSPDYTVLFAITGGANASHFYIDSCSGQVKVRQAAIIFNIQRQYVLNVTASVADFPLTTTTQQIVVNVIEVDWAPVVLATTFVLPENPASGMVVGSVPFFDQNGDNVTFSLTDGASDRFVVLPNGDIVVAANQTLNSINFETQALPFTLVIQVTETSAIRKPTASGLSSTGRISIVLSDQDDPPVPTGGQLLWVSEDAVNTGGGALTNATVTAADEDNTYNGNFSSPLSFTLLSPAAAALVPACAAASQLYPSLPTVDGTATGAPLFSVSPLTGALLVQNGPLASVSSLAAYGFSGSLVRVVFSVCVRVQETNFSGPTSFGVAPATVAVMAIVQAVPIVTAIAAPAGGLFATTGGPLTVTGTNFGNPGQFPTSAWAISTTPPRRVNLTACAATSSTSITCTMPPASGALYTLYVSQALSGGAAAATVAAMPSPLSVSFKPPTITTVTGNTGVKAATGGNLTIVGTDFSLNTAADDVKVQLGTGAEKFDCSIVPALTTQTTITCTLKPWYGASWPWVLSVGGQTVDALSTQLVSYEQPVITAIAAASGTCPGTTCIAGNFSLTTLATVPVVGQFIKLSGTGFGPEEAPVRGTYGGINFGKCVHELANRGLGPSGTVYCTTVPGVGALLQVVLFVGEQPSPAFVATPLSYAPPVITSAKVASPMSTVGGAAIAISGSGFGPANWPTNQITKFTYGPGPSGSQYAAAVTTCAVADDTRALCYSIAGVGANLFAQITIASQASAVFAAGLAYQAPSVFTFSGAGANLAANAFNTQGGEQVTITGVRSARSRIAAGCAFVPRVRACARDL